MAKQKTLLDKMAAPAAPEIVLLKKDGLGFKAGARMLIPTPRQIEAYVNSIPKGETRTAAEMRQALASEEGAELACPLCSGMFLRIVSEASLDPATGVEAPFWRVVDPKSPLANKLPCGPEWIQAQRDAEV